MPEQIVGASRQHGRETMLPPKRMMGAEADMGRRWQTVRRQSDVPLAGLADSGGWVPEAGTGIRARQHCNRTNVETPAPPTGAQQHMCGRFQCRSCGHSLLRDVAHTHAALLHLIHRLVSPLHPPPQAS